jgi:hypothetical protein
MKLLPSRNCDSGIVLDPVSTLHNACPCRKTHLSAPHLSSDLDYENRVQAVSERNSMG